VDSDFLRYRWLRDRRFNLLIPSTEPYALSTEVCKSPRPLDEPHLYDYAVKALGRQMRTEAELRRLMAARAEMGEQGEAAVRAVVGRLKEHGYLNDRSFAETYARLRQQNEKLGERRVRNDLQQ